MYIDSVECNAFIGLDFSSDIPYLFLRFSRQMFSIKGTRTVSNDIKSHMVPSMMRRGDGELDTARPIIVSFKLLFSPLICCCSKVWRFHPFNSLTDRCQFCCKMFESNYFTDLFQPFFDDCLPHHLLMLEKVEEGGFGERALPIFGQCI